MTKQGIPMIAGWLTLAWAVSGATNAPAPDKSGSAAIDKPGKGSLVIEKATEIGNLIDSRGIVVSQKILQTAVPEAMIKAIDPGGGILTREQVARRQEEEKGIFYGVGLKIKIKDQRPVIIEITKGSPAETAGIKKGMVIEKINDSNTTGLTLEENVNRLRGGKDEEVALTVRGEETNAVPKVVTLRRATIQMPVTGTMEFWPQQIGYLKVNGLYEGSGTQIVAQLKSWSETNCYGFILDLRGADGMNLESVAEVAGLFTPARPSLFTIQNGQYQVLETYPVRENRMLNRPVMVLVDHETCGAAELLAAVLQDCRGAMLIGTATRGDDRLREAIPLADGRLLYIAVRRIDLGKGTSYFGAGVQPQIVVAAATAKKTGPDQTAEITDIFAGLSDQEKQAAAKEPGPNGAAEITDLFSGLSDQEKNDRALIARVGQDAVLRRAVDLLLGLKALNIQVH